MQELKELEFIINTKMGKRWAKGDFCDIIPDKMFGIDISNCCYLHDVDYMNKVITRQLSDNNLKRCWRERCSEKNKIWAYYLLIPVWVGLRAIGWIRWKGIIN